MKHKKIIIIYWSIDGQTKKISEFLSNELDILDYIPEISPYSEIPPNLEYFDSIILGASIRYGKFPKTLVNFIEQNLALLNQKGSFFGVNLTARKEGKDAPDTNPYMKKFLTSISWKPLNTAVFAGALFYPRYTWYNRIAIQAIMLLTHGETNSSLEKEYTSWDKVREFAGKF